MALTKADSQVVTISATDVGLGNVTNESKTTMFSNSQLTNITTVTAVNEIVAAVSGATGTVNLNTSLANTWLFTSTAANFTANFTNVSGTDNRATTYQCVMVQGAAAYLPTAAQFDSTPVTINWAGATVPTGTPNRIDVVLFQLLRVGGVQRVIGSMGSY